MPPLQVMAIPGELGFMSVKTDISSPMAVPMAVLSSTSPCAADRSSPHTFNLSKRSVAAAAQSASQRQGSADSCVEQVEWEVAQVLSELADSVPKLQDSEHAKRMMPKQAGIKRSHAAHRKAADASAQPPERKRRASENTAQELRPEPGPVRMPMQPQHAPTVVPKVPAKVHAVHHQAHRGSLSPSLSQPAQVQAPGQVTMQFSPPAPAQNSAAGMWNLPGIVHAQPHSVLARNMIGDSAVALGSRPQSALNYPVLHQPVVGDISGQLWQQQQQHASQQAWIPQMCINTALNRGGQLMMVDGRLYVAQSMPMAPQGTANGMHPAMQNQPALQFGNGMLQVPPAGYIYR
uniref:Uncharacterized protein n=1 Tax=Chlamydomonas euryale TaxID=1486919 RepID=A0A7R9YY35_9CHLO|mmetsp:Transcript_33574/g.99970  ORF Transcript_33574/g.99970 Transcript_33574/m.99970 type:complete len:348 (+) Transcript_33574:428-1471(+)